MTARLCVAGSLVIIALAGCTSNQSAMHITSATSALTEDERRHVLWWLVCEECIDGELDTVKILGHNKPATVDTLGEDLLGGPSATRRDNVRKQFEQSFEEDTAYAVSEGSSLQVDRDEYVDHYLDNFVNLYRVRAARALAEIGGPKAGVILDSAAQGVVRSPGDTLRADAQLAVLFARDSILPGAAGTVDSTSP